MPIHYLRSLTSRQRTEHTNRQLGLSLAFIAGAVNAGGFLAVDRYTSHMTGIVSAMADDLALGNLTLALGGLGALLSFILGAASSAILINWGRRKELHSEYALPLLLEALLLLLFGLLGARMEHHQWLFVSSTTALLCFLMGLQNAIITKVSKAEIRTTHVTGLVTDLGIELGKRLYWNRNSHAPPVLANRKKMTLLAGMLSMFFGGGLLGAIGFKYLGFVATLPLGLLLLLLATIPVLDDVTERLHH